MKSIFKFFALGLFLAFAGCSPSKKAVQTSAADNAIEFVILQLNDVYEISPLGDGSGGLARVAGLRKQLLAKNPNTFTVLSGDFISPSVTGTLKYEGKRIKGKQMVETLNTLGLDWVVFGNHEFDYDMEDLQSRLDESNFTWLAANARYVHDDHIQSFYKNRKEGPQPCPDNMIVNVKGPNGASLRLGIFGVLVNSGRKPYVQYTDFADVTARQVTELAQNSDVLIALTHLDVADDLKLAGAFPQVSLWMGGHDHDNMMHKVGESTVAKADANARTVYIHTLRYDPKTGKTTVRSELKRIDASIPEDPATAAVVAKWETIKVQSLQSAGFDPAREVKTLKEPLDCRDAFVRHKAAPVGEMITGAMAAASKRNPECVLLNSGSIRVDDVLIGQLTELDIVRMLPFGGGISEVEMKGDLLKQTLDASLLNQGKGGFLQTKSIKYLEPQKQWLIAGIALNPAKTYRVTLPDFLLTGNESNMGFLKTNANADGSGTDNPGIFKWYKADPTDKKDLRNDIRWALIEYLRAH